MVTFRRHHGLQQLTQPLQLLRLAFYLGHALPGEPDYLLNNLNCGLVTQVVLTTQDGFQGGIPLSVSLTLKFHLFCNFSRKLDIEWKGLQHGLEPFRIFRKELQLRHLNSP